MATDEAPPRRARFHGRVELPDPTPCAHPGCTAAAEFRAPASNRVAGHVGGWQWLCLDHVREFNAGYNFFDGMAPDEISEAQSPMAGWAHVVHEVNGYKFNDPMNVLHGKFGKDAFAGRRTNAGTVLAEADVKALKVLGLDASYPLDPSQGLTDIGMDSLMAVELSNRLSVLVDRALPSTLARYLACTPT